MATPDALQDVTLDNAGGLAALLPGICAGAVVAEHGVICNLP